MIYKCFFLTLFCFSMQVSAGNDKKIKIDGLSNLVLASMNTAFNEGVKLSLVNKNNHSYPRYIDLYYSQVKFKLAAVFDDSSRVIIPFKFPIGEEVSDVGLTEKDTNSYFLGTYDFDGDGASEIVFGVVDFDAGTNLSNVAVNIYSYTPPLNLKDQGRLKNWDHLAQLVAMGIVGDVKIKFDKSSISIPRNHRGFFYEYTWVKDRFIDTGEY